MPFLLRLAGKLNYFELKEAMALATPEEKVELHPALLRKRKAALENGKRALVMAADRGE